MRIFRDLNNSIFTRASDSVATWLIPSLARFTFAATLLWFFWHSALTKIGEGAFGFLNPSFGAYAAILPWRPEAHSLLDTAIVLLAMWAEFALPLLIVVGLFTRAASLGMIVFVAIMCAVDIYGHKVDPETIGTWFDGRAGSVIADQRLFWVLLLATLVLKGAGPISIDRLFKIP